MANIPVADKHEDTAVSQHLVPRCYMKEWSYNPKKTSVWLYEKGQAIDTDIVTVVAKCTSKRFKKINAVDNYYDIKAGSYFMPEEALKEIYGPTMHLKISVDGEILDTEKKRNNRYGIFDEWEIKDKSDKPLSDDERLKLKKYFNEARFVFIEKEWGRQYENNWRSYVHDLYNKIIQTKQGDGCDKVSGKTVSTLITSDTIDQVFKMRVIFDIRGFSSDEYLNQKIDDVFDMIPDEITDMELEPEDRMHPIEVTVKESFRHQYILHICYDILKDNKMTGIAETIWKGYKEHLIPTFCLADIGHPFVTSERPVFTNTLNTGEKECIFVALPTLLISFGRGDKGKFYICSLTEDEVDEYNRAIIKNNDYIISCTNVLDVANLFG